MSLKDAWNCTLRDFLMLCENKKNKPIVLFDGGGDDFNNGNDLAENFELVSIYKSLRARHG